jgi:hypothetical protein
MTKPKLNTLLAKTDHLATSYKSSIKDYIQFFKDKQSAFRGEKKTYEAKSGTIDIPSERGNKMVVTTVNEKLAWLRDTNAEYIDSLFSQEATNAAGVAKSKLTVDGIEFGQFSSLELLRLKSLIENGEIEQMYANIPVRADDEEWNQTTEDQYKEREIFESKKQEGARKSITKESYIISDPNVKELKDSSSYKPQVATKDTVMELGDYTYQKFSGEWSHRERAELLRRRTKLLSAVIEALKISNEAEIVESNMTADKLFGYLHTGKI